MESLECIMFTYLELMVLLILQIVKADLQVYLRNEIRPVLDFPDMTAAFGENIPPKGMSAFLVLASPEDACSPIEPPPHNVTNFTKHWAVLIKRSNCTYEDKVLSAQNAKFDLAVVYNNESNELVKMQATHPERVYIPSVFIGKRTGLLIKDKYLYDKGFFIMISEDPTFDFSTMLIPFLIVISLCLITMLGFLIVKCIKDQRRARKRRLPNSSLRKIPTAKFRKGDPYETCAICLDDYVEGEKLRILPCSHAYHCKCIDPWLTRNRRVCPMCKRKVFAAGERAPSDTDSASEDDDQTPLLRTAQQTHSGTFTRVFSVAIVNRARSSINNSDEQDDSSSSSTIPQSSSSDISRDRIGQHSRNEQSSQGRSPSRNALLGSRENVAGERNEVVI